MTLTYTYVSSSEFVRTLKPPSVSCFDTAASMASWFNPHATACALRSSTSTPRLFRPFSSAPGR